MPQTVGSPELNGIQIFEWGLHDRNFSVASTPADLIDYVRDRYGEHPVPACDLHKRRQEGYGALLGNLLSGVETKTQLLLDLMAREAWDLFSCAYGETHCVGHQFWHFRDGGHPWHEPDAPAEFRDAIQSVYQRIDRGIGELIVAAGPDTTVLVVASHGMGPYTGGPQLLPEVLVRLGLGSEGGRKSFTSLTLRWVQECFHHAPRPIQPFLKALARTGPVMRIQSTAGCLLDPLESSRTKACALRNNRCGAIRLNLKGREPHGRVEPRADAEALIDEIRRELMELKDPWTGEPIVDRVITATEAFGPDHHPDVPDIMVVFRTDLGILERCHSTRVGEVYTQLYYRNIPRSGDHTTESRLWAVGPGITPGNGASRGNVLDLAPTVLTLLDVPIPQRTNGRPLAGCEAWARRWATMTQA